MQLLVFWLAYPLIWCISILPFPILYAFSDFVRFLVYNVFGYRKVVVRKNIKIALPHLSDAERLEIERKFYSHMCDTFLEMAKTMTISKKELAERFRFVNVDVLHDYEKTGKSLILMCAHYASWEWLIAITMQTKFHTAAIYKKIANKHFDKLVRDIRMRFNAELIESQKAIDAIHEHKEKGIQTVYGFVSDQSPQLTKARHWDYFMGLEVPIHTGAEMLAKKLDLNVVYCRIVKVKRGYYEATLIPMAENTANIPDYKITEMYLREVEKQILEAPEFYLWTHKRWKHAGKKKKSAAAIQETNA